MSTPVITPDQTQTSQGAPQPQSRLGAIMQSVAKTVSTGLAGIPDQGRPNVISALGEGARAEQGAQATQNAIKFKNFDDQVRLAQLHNQDLKMQQDTQAQTDAHKEADLHITQLEDSLGMKRDVIPSDGGAVMDHLASQTSANGAASVPAGTRLSGDGESINIPSNNQQTQEGQKQFYKMLAPAMGLTPLQDQWDKVPPQNMNMLMNRIYGFGIDGKPVNHDDLPTIIARDQSLRDNLAKNNGNPQQLQTLDDAIKINKANLDSLDAHAAGVKKQSEQATIDAQNSPESIAGAAKKASATEQAKLNVTNSPANVEAAANLAGKKASAETEAKNAAGGLNSVAFDPNYQNPDGTKGANVVMNNADAQSKGLQAYKASPEKLNATVAGMNDVQNKLNQLAGVVNDPNRMGQVSPGLAAAMLAHGKGIQADFHGVGVDTSRINEMSYAHDVGLANQATKDFVTAFVGAHEAITQLPRLQTFGQSSRMTQTQLEAALNLLPQAGDGAMASQKMTSLQGMIDPLRKQIPHMPGAETMPSWLEKSKQPTQQMPTPVGRFNPSTKTLDWVKQQ